jgi:tetratricopeptide (TPR) repeat protein
MRAARGWWDLRIGPAAILSAALAITAAGAAGDEAASRNNEGNRLYLRQEYDEALKRYTEAQASRPGAPELHYNIGNVLYRKGELDKAAEEYRRAQAAPDRRLAQAALYNRGNALMTQGRLQEAVGAYVQALRARPDDPDAKRNLELALRLLQEQKKPQQDPSDPKEGPQGPKAPAGQGRQEEAPQSPAQKKPQDSGAMSEEEARRILEALREAEKEGIRRHVRASVPESRRPEKDW